jgi:hypothetical protein
MPAALLPARAARRGLVLGVIGPGDRALLRTVYARDEASSSCSPSRSCSCFQDVLRFFWGANRSSWATW